MAPHNISIAAAALAGGGSSNATLSAAAWDVARLCQASLELRPWQPAVASCLQDGTQGPSLADLQGRPPLTDRLLIRLLPGPSAARSADAATPAAAPSLTLCELSLFGLPAPSP